jgi:hypothetical protein
MRRASAVGPLALLCLSGIVAGAVIGACSKRDAMSVDMGPPDLARFLSSTDLAPSEALGCFGFIRCYSDCFFFGTNPSTTKCENECQAVSKPGAKERFLEAQGCGSSWCLYGSATPPAIPTPYKCTLGPGGYANTDGSPADEGTPCAACLAGVQAALYDLACPQATAAEDCKPSACTFLVDKCRGDIP